MGSCFCPNSPGFFKLDFLTVLKGTCFLAVNEDASSPYPRNFFRVQHWNLKTFFISNRFWDTVGPIWSLYLYPPFILEKYPLYKQFYLRTKTTRDLESNLSRLEYTHCGKTSILVKKMIFLNSNILGKLNLKIF